MIGGLIVVILGIAVAGLGLLDIAMAEGYEAETGATELAALGSLAGWLKVGVAVILVVLGMLGARGGRKARITASVVALGLGGLTLLGWLEPPTTVFAIVFATTFFVSAYLLLRSPSASDFRDSRLVIGGVAIAAILGVVAVSLAGSPGATQRLSNEPPAGRLLALAEVSPGQCFNEIRQNQVGIGVELRSCDGPHEYEMIASETYASANDAEYPGVTALRDRVFVLCSTAFIDYVGIPPASSTLEYSFQDPTETSWSEGDRSIACFVGGPPPAAPLVGSVRGTKR
jgi:hypothetical protein